MGRNVGVMTSRENVIPTAKEDTITYQTQKITTEYVLR